MNTSGGTMTNKEEITSKIVDNLMLGKTMIEICKQEGMPSQRTINNWIKEDGEIGNKILQARRIGAFHFLDKSIEELKEEPKDNSDIFFLREKLTHYRWLLSRLIPALNDKLVTENTSKFELNSIGWQWIESEDEKSIFNLVKNVKDLKEARKIVDDIKEMDKLEYLASCKKG